MKTPVRVDKITIEISDDELSPNMFDDPQDKEDIRTGKVIGLHIQATAMVSYPLNKTGDRRLEWLSSGGAGGVSVSSENDPYLKELYKEELADLQYHLSVFGIRFNVSKMPYTIKRK